ncbi:MAG TPA: hypothetical protein VKT81_18490 [Bryobacteraceae bacterium]|nr:hypothetical protein [Bryobacteraceae bacterium]
MDEDFTSPVSSNDGVELHPGYAAEPTHASNHPPEPAPEPAPPDSGSGNIDKIRDILFGAHMRDYEQRFARLEEALRKESLDIRDTTRRHLEALEAFVHKELAALDARLNTERAERSEGHSRLAADHASSTSSIYRKIGEVESQEAHAKREIRNDLLQQSKELTDAIRAKGEELVALLERRSQELQHAKTDRAALASLFSEVSLRLTDQFKVTDQ